MKCKMNEYEGRTTRMVTMMIMMEESDDDSDPDVDEVPSDYTFSP